MNYEQKYKQALERARIGLHDCNLLDCDDMTRKVAITTIYHLFPELTESDDERIRKGIIRNLQYLMDRSEGFVKEDLQERIAWLEKQGEQKPTLPKWKYKKDHTPLLRDSLILNKYGCVAKSPSGAIVSDVWVLDYDELAKLPKEEFEKQGETFTKKDVDDAYLQGICDAKNEIEKRSEQPPADKVEPKPKVGDWGIDNCGYVWQIKEIRDQFYLLEGVEGDESWATIEWVNKNFHLWTIQDAKDGDVLHSIGLHGDCIFIFNGLDKWKFDEPNGDRAVATGYCCLTLSANNMEFGIQGPDCIEVDTVKPTTKEQRDLFFSKMKESGYVWNADKKELNKQTPKNLITQLTDIPENKCGTGEWSGLTTREMTYEEWKELTFEKPHYSDDENIQKKFEFAVKMTGIVRVFSAMCKEFNDESLKRFIEEYFEDNKLWTDYYEDS